MTKLRVGAVVRLRSGGPEMTVDAVDVSVVHDVVYCMWFSESGERHLGVFPTATLKVFANGPAFDIAEFEGQSMPNGWKREVRYKEKIALIHFRLGREFERLCHRDHEFMRFA